MIYPSKHYSALLLAAAAFLVLAPALKAGGIVVSNDEYLFADCCLTNPNDTQFALNIAGWLTGGSGNILIVSNDMGVDGFGSGNTQLIALLTANGYSVTVATTTPTTLTALLGYQAVYLAAQGPDGNPVNNTLLTTYVNSGGSVFLEGGTGKFASGTAEAAAWNPFLNSFGLSFASSYNGVCGGAGVGCGTGINVSAFQTQGPYGPALFAGVNTLTINNGNNVVSLFSDPYAQVFSDPSGNGLYGAVKVVSSDKYFQVRYAANLNVGESYIDITNTGANGAPLLGPGLGAAVGNICVNVYAFDPSEELVSCCSCLVTPDQTVNLGVIADLTSKTLTGVVPTSVTVKLLATLAGAGGTGTGTVCNNSAASVTTATIAAGMGAWGTTLHPPQATGTYSTTESPFTPSTLSTGELDSIAGRCAAIIGNASGFGICTSCRPGALGGQKL